MEIAKVVVLSLLVVCVSSQGTQQDCIPGEQWTGTQCQSCPVGTFQPLAAQTSCNNCPQGTSTIGSARRSADHCYTICGAGERYSTSEGQCLKCEVGYYGPGGVTSNQLVVTTCQQCDASTPLTAGEGSTSVSDCRANCPAGNQLDANGNCVQCQIGFYKTADEVRCQACPTNFKTASTGTTSAAGCSILECPAGQFGENGECKVCPSGSYQDVVGSTDCKSCGNPSVNWRTTPGAARESDCQFICEDGQYISATQLCSRCLVGTYRSNAVNGFAATSCQACPTGFTTAAEESTSQAQCNIAVCGRGQQNVAGNLAQCEVCPMNTYQNDTAQRTCVPCPTNFRTLSVGTINPSDCRFACDSGYEERVPGSRDCVACEIGFFKDNSVDLFGSCTGCTNGRITASTASTSATACNTANCQPGTYRVVNTNQCELCGRNTYQDEKWQTECKDCPAEKPITFTSGANNVQQCKLNCPSGQELNSAETGCVNCPTNQYRDAAQSFTCQNCPGGLYTESVGAESSSDCAIRDCPAGEFSPSANDPCQRCPIGTYQTQPRQRRCESCPVGRTTNFEGTRDASLCLLTCPAGQQPHDDECEECPRGYYKAENSPGPCLSCQNTLTPDTGSTSATDCTVPLCFKGTRHNSVTNLCEPCPLGTYQNEDFENTCKTCPTGTTTYVTNANDVSACQSTDQCELNRDNCHASAVCTFVAPNSFRCSCPTFTTGDGLSGCVHPCDNTTYCGDGSCVRINSGNGAQCECPDFYSGTHCEIRSVPKDKLPLIVGSVIGSVVGVIVLVAIAVCLCWCIRRSHVGESDTGPLYASTQPRKEVYESVMTPAIKDLPQPPALPPRPAPAYAEPPLPTPVIQYLEAPAPETVVQVPVHYPVTQPISSYNSAAPVISAATPARSIVFS